MARSRELLQPLRGAPGSEMQAEPVVLTDDHQSLLSLL
jgi:hypothetical protein